MFYKKRFEEYFDGTLKFLIGAMPAFISPEEYLPSGKLSDKDLTFQVKTAKQYDLHANAAAAILLNRKAYDGFEQGNLEPEYAANSIVAAMFRLVGSVERSSNDWNIVVKSACKYYGKVMNLDGETVLKSMEARWDGLRTVTGVKGVM